MKHSSERTHLAVITIYIYIYVYIYIHIYIHYTSGVVGISFVGGHWV